LQVKESKRKEDGRGPFIKEKIKMPPHLKGIKKRLKRYGISRDELITRLSILPEPDLVLITSIMTYWYMGTKEVLEVARHVFPKAKIIVGGIYPTLCYEHATFTLKEADLIIKNNEINLFYDFVENTFSIEFSFKYLMHDLNGLLYPCFDLYDKIHFIPLLTSFGCIYKCAYCATPYMYPKILRRNPVDVIEEVFFWLDKGISRFVLYDDNFLYKSNEYAKPILKGLENMNRKIDIYNPNALNGALIDDEVAGLLKSAGFKEVRLGLESIDPVLQRNTGNKIDRKTFEKAVGSLKKAGFDGNSIGVYIMAGLPFQKWTDVKDAIDYLIGLGVRPHIAEYTPIPHTRLFDEYSIYARYPIREDPVFQNNALFPFCWEGFTEENLMFLKHYLREK
ncbi:MAG: radical SAM protein, partial [Syntrophorhabdaceae bacterium]|nr:radical SAM protein [Syntrophorhabdaceae bacterium]